MYLTKHILTRREPLKRVTPRIKLHIPLIKLIKKDHYVWERSNLAQLTKMQTQGIYIKDIKWLGNPSRHTVLKCSMKMYLKVIGVVHVILTFLKVLLLLKRLWRWLLVLLRWINVYSRSQRQNESSTYTYMQTKTTLRNSTPIHQNSEQN